MAVTAGKTEVRPTQWFKDTWQWRVDCTERTTYFMTERAAKSFGKHNPRCTRMSRSEWQERGGGDASDPDGE